MLKLGDRVYWIKPITAIVISITNNEKCCQVCTDDHTQIETAQSIFEFIEHCSDEELLTHCDKRVRNVIHRRRSK